MKCTIKKMAIIVALFIAITMWAVPNTINFQGALKDADGVPVNETQFMEFRIYDSATNGSLLWSEQHLSVTISDGIFNVELGETTPFVNLFDNAELYITFYFGGEEMAPRQQLLAVPYAMQADEATHATSADNATTVGSVGIANLVQQDGSGNATITSTMTANAFVGDGSALTGISAAYDNLYVNTTGPDTMTANTDIGGYTLTVENDGDGSAICIQTAGNDGVRIASAGGDGVYVGSVGGDGVLVAYADYGVSVSHAGNDGVNVWNAGSPSTQTTSDSKNGFEVAGAEGNGLYVGRADYSGVSVNSAGDDGFSVYNAGSPSTQQTSSAKNGFEVAGAEGSGLYVGRADLDGVHVYFAGDDGVDVISAGDDGVDVISAGDDGFNVYNAGSPSTQQSSSLKNGFEVAGAEGDGLYVGRADLDGVFVNSAGNDGVSVYSAGYYGVYVGSAGNDGVSVYNAGDDGVYVNSADDDGVYVYSAGDDGVYANTTQASHEWGLTTPDKIYGSNVTMRSQSTHVRYVGNEMLEAGDLVCIAGGYEEDILDDGFPIINVTKANSRNSSAIIGVVEYKVYIREEIEEHEGETHTEKSFRFAEGSASYGDYLSVIVFGPADVKMDSRSDVKIGESVVADAGFARKIKTTEINGITIAENSGVIGKALEDSNGNETIKIFVNCK